MDPLPGTSGSASLPKSTFYSKKRWWHVESPPSSSDEDTDCEDEAVIAQVQNMTHFLAEGIPMDEIEDETLVLEDEETDTAPITQLKRKKPVKMLWEHVKAQLSAPDEMKFSRQDNDDDDEVLLSPLEYFKMFISQDVITNIVEQSNLYAIQKDPNKPLELTNNEFEQWLGSCMYMSISKLSNTRLHWAVDTNSEMVTSVFSRNRWEKIKSCLHLVDNTKIDRSIRDKFSKIRPLVRHLQSEFRKIAMNECLCVDEQMVPFKGVSSAKQYIPKKFHKWGYKIFVLADNEGLVYDFFIYDGKILPVDDPQVPDLGACSNAVLTLAKYIPPNKNHKLYFDNWFNSYSLMEHLATRSIWCCGTVQARRLPSLAFKTDEQLSVQGRGSFDEWKTKFGNNFSMSAIKWYDTQSVFLTSTFLNSYPIGSCKRRDRKAKEIVEVPIPNIVKNYNEYMGTVDLHDQLISYYRMSFRSKKYYMRLVFHLFDMAVVNSWQLYRRAGAKLGVEKSKQNSLCEFKFRLARGLIMSGKDMMMKRGRPSNELKLEYERKRKIGRATKPIPTDEIRKDGIGHYPDVSSRGTCKMPGCSSKVNTLCTKCNIHLCIDKERKCFLKFHIN